MNRAFQPFQDPNDQNDGVQFRILSSAKCKNLKATPPHEKSKNRKLVEHILKTTQDALYSLNLNSKTALFSPAFYTQLGYKPFEMPQTLETWQSMVHPDDEKTIWRSLNDSGRSSDCEFDLQYRMKTKNLGWKWISAHLQVVEADNASNPVLVLGSHRTEEQEGFASNIRTSIKNKKCRDTAVLNSTLEVSGRFGSIVGKSNAMREVYGSIFQVARSNSNVVVYGESGTGKELVAQTIHELSSRHKNKFVTINCGAIPSDLIESEFFGYKKGAFTGANCDKAGYLDWAENGTLFLDEVGELNVNMQAKLLRAIEGGGYTPVGDQVIKKPNVRIIAATNHDLKEKVRQGLMREDFFYRLHILPIHLPPLRDRKDDLPLLIDHFMRLYGDESSKSILTDSARELMLNHRWPGNVRELQNTIRRYVTYRKVEFIDEFSPAETSQFEFDKIPQPNSDTFPKLQSILQDAEKAYIKFVLERSDWHRGKAAQILDINRRTLYKKINQYEIGK